jgi:hypothetical protein
VHSVMRMRCLHLIPAIARRSVAVLQHVEANPDGQRHCIAHQQLANGWHVSRHGGIGSSMAKCP